ncbi:hypothetical protein FIBSPDRAFT_727345, partial [Athelia psychrophila]
PPPAAHPGPAPARREKEKEGRIHDETQFNPDAINCICGSLYDDGFSIACDDCSRWCHAACFDIVAGEVPEEWKCWVCVPRAKGVDRERAARMQKERQREAERIQQEQARMRLSPGVERAKPRSRLIDIDAPWTHAYVPIAADLVPQHSTRDQLTRHAQNWRGVTAIAPPPPPPIAVASVPHPSASSARPPSYALHTTGPVPPASLIAPYASTVTSTSAYLADPLNAYAHLGMPKPFVHLLGPPLDVALDARIAGNEARFARSGCKPNAALRPVLCDSEEKLGFGVFALRALGAGEEVVLGWEWDDGHAVHALPALIHDSHAFPYVPPYLPPRSVPLL